MDIDGILDDVEEGQYGNKEYNYGGTDATIFVVECTDSMYGKCEFQSGDLMGEMLLKICLECCRETMLDMVRNSPRDLMSIVLFGTELKNNPLNVDHIYVLQELGQPSVKRMKELNGIVDGDLDAFMMKYGCSDDYEMSDIFWLCHRIFLESPKKLGSKRIILMTNSDNPHNGSQKKQHNARVTAKDLRKDHAEFTLVYLNDTFDTSKFYKELVEKDSDEYGIEWYLPQKEMMMSDLQKRIMVQRHSRRAYATLIFRFPRVKSEKTVEFAVRVFHLLRKTPMPKKVPVHRDTNQPVYRGRPVNSKTGELVESHNIAYSIEFGGEKAVFTSLEIKQLKSIMEPGIELMGFKPRDRIKPERHVKCATFIYPANDIIKGSSSIFSALLTRCLAKNVVPICWICERKGTNPRMAALVPQRQEFDKFGRQKAQDGFHVIYLPFKSEIREVDLQKVEEAPPDQVSIAKNIISKLKMTYRPQIFNNPRLQKKWQGLEAIALGTQELPEFQDSTIPDYEDMHNRLQSLSLEFIEATSLADYDSVKPGPKKRSSSGDTEGIKEKVKKFDHEDMVKLAKEHKINKLTVGQLRQYLQAKEVKGTSNKKKPELVQMVYDHLEMLSE